MFIFRILGAVFIIGIIAIFVLIFLIYSGLLTLRGRMDAKRSRSNQQVRSTGAYSTGSTQQRYYTQQQNNKSNRYSQRYTGPTAKRTYTNVNQQTSHTANQPETVEVPLLEVVDVDDK